MSLFRCLGESFLCAAVLCASVATGQVSPAQGAAREVQAKITRLDLFRDATVAVYRQLESGKAGETLLVPFDDAILFSSFGYDPSLISSVSRARWTVSESANYYKNAIHPYFGTQVEVTLVDAGVPVVYRGMLVSPKDWKSIEDTKQVCLLTDKGVITFGMDSLRAITALDGKIPDKQPMEKYGLTFTLRADGAAAISYVSKGLGWAPYCEIRLLKDNKMLFRQYAEILNEFGDFENVPVSLVSGDVRSSFEKRISLLSPNQSWADLLGSEDRQYASMSSGRASYGEVELSAQGTDFLFKKIGTFSLKKDDALNIPLLSGEIECKRRVSWYIGEVYRNSQSPILGGTLNIRPYDCMIFTNPFDEPIVNSPVSVYSNDRVLAQTRIQWVNPHSEAMVRLSTAEGLEGSYEDVISKDSPNKDEVRTIDGRTYSDVLLEGKIDVKNTRKNPMELNLFRNLNGVLISATGDPACTCSSENGDQETYTLLEWKLTLAPGETRTVHYTYRALKLY